jgi:hypothetical protein
VLPIRALHLRKIGEDPDRPLFPFFDEECNLRLKRRDFIAANPSDNLEPESSSPAFLKSFNHRRESPLNLLAERNSDLTI